MIWSYPTDQSVDGLKVAFSPNAQVLAVVRQGLVLGAVRDGLAHGGMARPRPVEVVVPEVLEVARRRP